MNSLHCEILDYFMFKMIKVVEKWEKYKLCGNDKKKMVTIKKAEAGLEPVLSDP